MPKEKTLREDLEAAYHAGPVVKSRKTGKVDLKATAKLREKNRTSLTETLHEHDRIAGRRVDRSYDDLDEGDMDEAGVSAAGRGSARRSGAKAGKIGMRRAGKEGQQAARIFLRDVERGKGDEVESTGVKPRRRKKGN